MDIIKDVKLSALIEWCEDLGVNPSHAFVLSGLPTDSEVSDIEELAQTVKVFRRVRIRGEKYHSQMQCKFVLCECRQAVNPDHTCSRRTSLEDHTTYQQGHRDNTGF